MNLVNMAQMFCNGDAVYKKVTKGYVVHKRGLFIVAPSGTGKSHYVRNQKEKHWLDGDVIWKATGAIPKGDWWKGGLEKIFAVDQKCDVITAECKRLGLWVLGASYYWLIPDAIVVPDLRTQKRYIQARQASGYDGGAKAEDLKNVLSHRKWLLAEAKKHKVPVFKTIEEAIASLTKRK